MAKKNVAKIKPKQKAFRMLFFGVGSCAFIAYFLIMIVSVSTDILGKYKEKDTLNEELDTLKEKEQELALDVLKLKDPEYVARYLREKFFYSKDGEYVIKIPKTD